MAQILSQHLDRFKPSRSTYDSDTFYDETKEFLSFIAEYAIPLFCNVNVRAEFLEIHRRIIFSEALFDFNDAIDKAKLPIRLASQLGKWSKSNKTRKDQGKAPLRLSEADLKWVKLELMKITDGKNEPKSSALLAWIKLKALILKL